jgi:hypothetical protein
MDSPPAQDRAMMMYSSIRLARFPMQIIVKGAKRVIATKIPYWVAGVLTKPGLLTRIMETTIFAIHQLSSCIMAA